MILSYKIVLDFNLKVYLIKYTLFSLLVSHKIILLLQIIQAHSSFSILIMFVININFNFNELFLLLELFGVKSKMCLESKSRRSNASGEV